MRASWNEMPMGKTCSVDTHRQIYSKVPIQQPYSKESPCPCRPKMLKGSHALTLICLKGPSLLLSLPTTFATCALSGTLAFEFTSPAKSSMACFTVAWAIASCTLIGAYLSSHVVQI